MCYFFMDFLHGFFEPSPVFRFPDGVQGSPQQFNAQLFQNPALRKLYGHIQTGLPAQCRQNAIREFPAEDPDHHFQGDGFDVNFIGHVRVGHDGGGIAVYQHHFDVFLPKSLAGLGTGIVEFGCLSNDDRAGANDQYFIDIMSFRHGIHYSFLLLQIYGQCGNSAAGYPCLLFQTGYRYGIRR